MSKRLTFVVELQARVGGDDSREQAQLTLVGAEVGRHGCCGMELVLEVSRLI